MLCWMTKQCILDDKGVYLQLSVTLPGEGSHLCQLLAVSLLSVQLQEVGGLWKAFWHQCLLLLVQHLYLCVAQQP